MLRNAKAKGSRRELQVQRFLEDAGYGATKAGGSLGIFDILSVPFRDDVPISACRCIQCKSNRPPSPAERRAIEAVKLPSWARAEIWICVDRAGWTVLALDDEGWWDRSGLPGDPVLRFKRQKV